MALPKVFGSFSAALSSASIAIMHGGLPLFAASVLECRLSRYERSLRLMCAITSRINVSADRFEGRMARQNFSRQRLPGDTHFSLVAHCRMLANVT
jgi:hypothetical protein